MDGQSSDKSAETAQQTSSTLPAVTAEKAEKSIEAESTTPAAEPFFDPTIRIDQLSQRILAIELANGVGLSGRKIKEIGNFAVDEDTINKRRALGAYQRVLTDLRKDALSLIAETQAKAIRKLREQIDDKDSRISQRAALFFAESTMAVHTKRAEAELMLEMQFREHKFVKKTIVEFEMDSSIPVLGEPAPVAHVSPSTTPDSSAIVEPLPESRIGEGIAPGQGNKSAIKVQEIDKKAATDLEQLVTLESSPSGSSPQNTPELVTPQLPNNTPRVVEDLPTSDTPTTSEFLPSAPATSSSNSPQQVLVELEADDDDILGDGAIS